MFVQQLAGHSNKKKNSQITYQFSAFSQISPARSSRYDAGYDVGCAACKNIFSTWSNVSLQSRIGLHECSCVWICVHLQPAVARVLASLVSDPWHLTLSMSPLVADDNRGANVVRNLAMVLRGRAGGRALTPVQIGIEFLPPVAVALRQAPEWIRDGLEGAVLSQNLVKVQRHVWSLSLQYCPVVTPGGITVPTSWLLLPLGVVVWCLNHVQPTFLFQHHLHGKVLAKVLESLAHTWLIVGALTQQPAWHCHLGPLCGVFTEFPGLPRSLYRSVKMALWPAMANGEMFVWLLFEAAARSGGRRAAAEVFMERIAAESPGRCPAVWKRKSTQERLARDVLCAKPRYCSDVTWNGLNKVRSAVVPFSCWKE